MAMVLSRSGQANGTGDQNTLFLKQFAGEVISVFEEANVMMPLHTVRTISSAKSAQFPATGTASATYHTPGESLITDKSEESGTPDYLSNIKHNEIVVTINDLLTSSCFVANLDEAKTHYDVRSEYTRQMGFALANKADRELLVHGLLGARFDGGTEDRFGGGDYLGSSIDIGSDAVTAAELLTGIQTAAQTLDEKDVPSNDRYVVLTPANYYKLIMEDQSVINRDYGNDGNGSIASGVVLSVAGFRIFKSNHLPTADFTADTGDNSSLTTGTFTGSGNVPHALCFHRSAMATVKLLDLGLESDYMVERQGTLMVAKYAMGHEVIRREALVELKA